MRVADYWNASPFRLALIYSLLFIATVALVLGLVYWHTVGYLARDMERSLSVRMLQLKSVSVSRLPEAIATVQRRDLLHQGLYGYFDTDGHHLAGNLLTIPQGMNRQGYSQEIANYQVEDGHDEMPSQHARLALFIAAPLAQGRLLIVGRNVTELHEIKTIILYALVEGGIVVLVLVLALSVLLSLRAVRRIGAIADRCERIASGDLDVRLTLSSRGDELDMLSSVINSMLDRIQGLMHEVQNVCNNVAHDLMTPMTRLRARLFRLQRDLDAEPASLLERVLEDTDSVLARFRAILRIAELESNKRRSAFSRVDLADLLLRLQSFYAPLLEDRNVQIDLCVQNKPLVDGDDELLFEAVSNLLDNAIKFSPQQGRIKVSLSVQEGCPQIDIQDQGPGIPDGERQAVLQRYFRGTGSAAVEGHGLGLSIVAVIMNLHGCDFCFEPVAAGALARIRFPSVREVRK